MSLSSIHERTWNAAMNLATSASSIQERIGNAYLAILPLKPEEFPEDLRGKIRGDCRDNEDGEYLRSNGGSNEQ